MESTVVDISIPSPSFKPVSLSSPRSPLSKNTQTSLFLTQYIYFDIFYHTLFTVFIIYFFSFNVKKFIFYSAQKKKLSKRRSGGFKVKPTNQDGATAETKGVDNDATEKESDNEFENEEYGDAEILAACTIQSCWKLYRLKQMFGMYFKSEESVHRVYGKHCS
jgi:hypothetical protein